MGYCYNSDMHSVEERIEAFYIRWFDKKAYKFSSGSKFEPSEYSHATDWLNKRRFLSSLCASLCMEGIHMDDIIGNDSVKWCLDNPYKILVVYCGEKFNLEMKFCRERGLLYRQYKEYHV